MALQTDKHYRNQVMYSVFVRNHSKEGTFTGVRRDLDRIQSLGVDIIWLMPIHPLGEVARKGTLGSPYAIRDYRAVNPEYGTLEDFVALVEDIHSRGMKCIIDVVYNHTSPDSRLAQEHPEWFYHKPDGAFGNRIGDWTDIIDLDYSHRELWVYQIETLKQWARIVDGFRCDVAPLIPLEFWLEALEAYFDAVDYADIMEEALEMANLPADIVDELVREMESEIGSTDMSGLLELVEDLDGLTFQVCVSGGKVAAVLFEEELDGSDVELALYIGGKDAYMDEISLELSVDSMEYEIVWEGDHTAESGTFTDEMTCTYSYSGTVRSEFTLATELDTGSKADNLTMEFRMNGAAVILEGTWQADKDGLALEADSIRVEENNTTLLELSLDYSAGAYTDRVDTGSVRLLATIDSTGLEELLVAIEEKAATWAVDLFNKYPSLMNYI